MGHNKVPIGTPPRGLAPYGVFEDEIDAGMDDLDAGECHQPY